MKKSKVIIPAMAMILFSTAASISGTVAWFTANRVFNTTIGNFSVAETEGNLACTLAASIGTINNSTTSVSIQKADTGVNEAILTHGSVNALTTGDNFGKAYVVDQDTGNTYEDRGKVKGNAGNTPGWLYRSNMSLTPVGGSTPSSVDVYIAVSWTMTFTYTFGGETNPVAVYLDLGNSQFNTVDPDSGYDFRYNEGNTLTQTGKGFRIGFYNAVYAGGTTAAENAHNVVWGNNIPVTGKTTFSPTAQYSVDAEVEKDGIVYKCITEIPAGGHAWKAEEWTPTGDVTAVTALSYIKGTTKDDVQAHDATNYVYYKGSSYAKKTSGSEDEDETITGDNAERICVLNSAHPSVTVTCAAWFEGTDPNVVSGKAMNCLEASMSFYARSVNPAS